MAQDFLIGATSELFAGVIATPAAQSLARRLEAGGLLACDGVPPAAQPFLAALLHQQFPRRPMVVVTEGLKAQEAVQQDLETWVGPQPRPPSRKVIEGAEPAPSDEPAPRAPRPAPAQPLFYPAWETLPHESRLPHADVISERLETLMVLAHGPAGAAPAAPLLVTSVAALLQRTFRRAALEAGTRRFNRGDRLDPLDLVEWLEAQGYEPEAQVTQKGELALRGGILDLYPLTSPWPVRLEFFGDELESLRHFDPLTQISREEIVTITIPPAGEVGLLKCGVRSAERGIKADGAEDSGGTAAEEATPALGTLLDYLPADAILVLCDPERLAQRAAEYGAQIPPNDPFYLGWEDFQARARSKGLTVLALSHADGGEDGSSPNGPFNPAGAGGLHTPHSTSLLAGAFGGRAPHSDAPHFQSLEAFRPLAERAPEPHVAELQRREFFAQLHRWSRQGYAVHVFCNNDGEAERFREIWSEYGLADPASSAVAHETAGTGGLWTHGGTLARGFLCESARLVVVTDAEIFGRYKVQRPRRLKSPHAQAARSALDIDFSDLEEGDYVVHLQHGIGRYVGLQILPLGAGAKGAPGPASATAASGQECLVIEYAANEPGQPAPKLYVPVTEAHLVSKYVGTGKARPPLNTLGGARWAKAKAQAERAVRDVASDLLSIQAARESQEGHAFAPDTPWQREFENAFLFEETPDQMRAIQEAKADMERPKPMDRLVCGDVGFGKTEVGIRAAFKAVMGGRQVAVLVPTTVLAQQHFNTFRERMADYPIRVELLSRFRTRREQQEVVRAVAAGSVDIVIGTHRLLQDDLVFKDLGLVVIDEEQRFGVMHKEKFKMLRKLVDVLTLSATPIPRTLYLALTGARDMSTIQTPPHDRLPVETIVTPYDERLIRDAIQRELNRGGQVFFLHNRVLSIRTMAQRLAGLLPKARIVVGHGQMDSDELERVMTQFINGEADILLSTTIIESGLDIPNANTIIIDRADRFGLSDLYQLRGRVGRYKHQAYAYLLLPRHGGLLTDVRKRMSAIKQYSTLGSGFKIAMRDLEIRGAGNLLGSEQSGHITAVGFELYCQLLKQSVASLKGQKVPPRLEVQVRFDFLALTPGGESPAGPGAPPPAAAYIPFSYVADTRQRIEIYRKLAQADQQEALEALSRELRDRFGPPPPALELLLLLGELKLLAAERGIHVLEVKDDKLMLTRNHDYLMVGSKFPRLVKKQAPARLKEIKKLLLAL